jgi:hypothetical protein
MTRIFGLLGFVLLAACSSSSGGGGSTDAGAGSGGTGNGGGAGGGTGGAGATGGGTGGSSNTVSCESHDEGNGCICANDPNGSNGAQCSEASLVGTVLCCADATYPSSGTCSCARSACNALSGLNSCSCGPAEADGVLGECVGYATCCNVELQGAIIGCVCDQSAGDCEGIGSPTASCAATTGTCGPNRVQVTSCSEP